MVAGLEVGHARADLLDDAGALVAQDRRERDGDHLVPDHLVGVAHPRRDHPHEDLARPGRLQVQLAHLERGARGRDHGCGDLHGCLLEGPVDDPATGHATHARLRVVTPTSLWIIRSPAALP